MAHLLQLLQLESLLSGGHDLLDHLLSLLLQLLLPLLLVIQHPKLLLATGQVDEVQTGQTMLLGLMVLLLLLLELLHLGVQSTQHCQRDGRVVGHRVDVVGRKCAEQLLLILALWKMQLLLGLMMGGKVVQLLLLLLMHVDMQLRLMLAEGVLLLLVQNALALLRQNVLRLLLLRLMLWLLLLFLCRSLRGLRRRCHGAQVVLVLGQQQLAREAREADLVEEVGHHNGLLHLAGHCCDGGAQQKQFAKLVGRLLGAPLLDHVAVEGVGDGGPGHSNPALGFGGKVVGV